MRRGRPLLSGSLPFRVPALLGLMLLAAPAAHAQSLGLSVNGSCEVGACPPATPVPVDTSAFVPYAFTVTADNGDSYGFAGQIGEQDLNGGTSLPGSMAITITYLGNSAGGPSRGTSFTTHVFYDFTANTSGSYALVADTGGAFSGGIGAGTSVTGLWTFDGTVQSSTFGPFVPPESFYQSETDNVQAPPNGVLTADVLTTVVFGAGSPVGSIIAVGAAPANALAAAVLPGARSVQVGNDATVFATILNAGTSAMTDCQVALPPSAPAGLQLTYQTTDPATNALTGTPNTPAAIAPGGAQTYLLDFRSTSAFTVSALPLFFDCDNTNPAASIAGVNTIDLLFSATPIPDIVALAATATNDGTVHVAGGAGAFAVATVDVGAAGALTVSADTGEADLPASIELCQTEATGQCLSPPSAAAPVSFGAGATPTFSIFVSSTDAIPFAPGSSRVFVRFKDGGGVSHGSTSVAVTTD
jgi:hypothetical protein